MLKRQAEGCFPHFTTPAIHGMFLLHMTNDFFLSDAPVTMVSPGSYHISKFNEPAMR
jgi:hypothetical protein